MSLAQLNKYDVLAPIMRSMQQTKAQNTLLSIMLKDVQKRTMLDDLQASMLINRPINLPSWQEEITPEEQEGGTLVTPQDVQQGGSLINRPENLPEWQEQIGNLEGGALAPVEGGVERSDVYSFQDKYGDYVEILKNPTSGDEQSLVKEYNKAWRGTDAEGEYPVRTAYDATGNKYIWRADLATHDVVANHLSKILGGDASSYSQSYKGNVKSDDDLLGEANKYGSADEFVESNKLKKPDLSTKQIENISRSNDFGGIEDDEISNLKKEGIKYFDGYHVISENKDIKDGIKTGEEFYNRPSSVYFFADPSDINNSLGYLSTLGKNLKIVHFKLPIEKLKEVKNDDLFAVDFGTYSSWRIESDIPKESIVEVKKIFLEEIDESIKIKTKSQLTDIWNKAHGK